LKHAETIVSVTAKSIGDALRAVRRELGVKIRNTREVMRNPAGPDAPETWRCTLEGGITVEVIIEKDGTTTINHIACTDPARLIRSQK
jgi:hypothetical protein